MTQIELPGEWTKAGWKLTEPGNYQNHIAEILGDGDDVELMMWVTGSDYALGGPSWSVKIGTDTSLSGSRAISRKRYDSEDEAILAAYQFAHENKTFEDAVNKL